ncbi:hypothetical protein SPFL3102_03552 [Sporomusaceae bacterium FL31]|nr:hypothetical protein SPFL3101_00453 [Sporomusaceae bacterium FL31]GCE35701.1 hypothetical protein SPFL3102_03552 [Sporomusaceae bacterium]
MTKKPRKVYVVFDHKGRELGRVCTSRQVVQTCRKRSGCYEEYTKEEYYNA